MVSVFLKMSSPPVSPAFCGSYIMVFDLLDSSSSAVKSSMDWVLYSTESCIAFIMASETLDGTFCSSSSGGQSVSFSLRSAAETGRVPVRDL